MEFNINFNENGNYDTSLYNLLANIKDERIFYNGEHKLIRPLAIYNRSILRVLNAFEYMIISLKEGYENVKEIENVNFEDINLKHKELVAALISFIDDGYHIMKCFYQRSRVTKKIDFADKWLRNVDKFLIDEYKEKIKPYRNKIAFINNKVKHNHARYEYIVAKSYLGKFSYGYTLGYYIAGVDENGGVMSDRDIHPLYRGQDTGSTYIFDLRSFINSFYYIAECMCNTIEAIMKKENFKEVKIEKISSDNSNRLQKIIKDIKSIKEIYFINEYDNITEINFSEDFVKLKKPCSEEYYRNLVKPTSYEYQMSTQLQYGTTAKLLYFGNTK